MGAEKQYMVAEKYERKIPGIMARLKVKEYNFGRDRYGCFIEFRYKGELYRFEHSVEKALSRGIKLSYGSDAFAQLVLGLEDLARITERGIYDLSTWVSGMKFLPPPFELPSFFEFMGFKAIPDTIDDVKERYRKLSKTMHPDNGGSDEDFKKLKDAAERGIKYLSAGRK